MAINVSVQYNGEFLPDIIPYYSVDPIYATNIGEPFKPHEEILSLLQPMFPPKHFELSPLFYWVDVQKV